MFDGYGHRTLYELAVFRNIIASWRDAVAILDSRPTVEHLSLTPYNGVAWQPPWGSCSVAAAWNHLDHFRT